MLLLSHFRYTFQPLKERYHRITEQEELFRDVGSEHSGILVAKNKGQASDPIAAAGYCQTGV